MTAMGPPSWGQMSEHGSSNEWSRPIQQMAVSTPGLSIIGFLTRPS